MHRRKRSRPRCLSCFDRLGMPPATHTAQGFGVVFMLVLMPGCITGSLASDTGPRPEGGHWSAAGRQMVHVGEEVEFDFVIHDWQRKIINPLGIADYVAAEINGDRVETEADHNGHFVFAYAFDDKSPDQKITIRATAYRQLGRRDFMRVRDRWLQSDSPYNDPDEPVADDAITLTVYRARIALELPATAEDLNMRSGVLRIQRNDGTRSVFLAKPDQAGFSYTGPEPDGIYRVTYVPDGDELNATGRTRYEFRVFDTTGRPVTVEGEIETP